MTKTPSAFEPTKPLTTEERAARKAFRQVEAEKAMSEHEAAQKAFSANRERLRSERLAREAAAAPVAVTKAKPKMSAEHARAVEWDGKVLSGWITVDGKPLKVSVDRETIHQHAPGLE